MNDILGVILAAGRGSRLYPLTNKIPKPLIFIGKKPLLEYHIDIMKQNGIEDIIIVIGYYGYEIAKYFGDGKKFGVNITYVEQKKQLGIANALSVIASKVERKPFLLTLGDIYFRTKRLYSMINMWYQKKAEGIIATKLENDTEMIKKNFSVEFNEDESVKRVVEKPKILVNKYKGCGIYMFDENIFESINRTPRTAMRDEYEITESIQLFIDAGKKVYCADIIEDDVNITYLSDLYRVNMKMLEGDLNSIISDKSTVSQSAVITKSIVCPDAVVENNVVLNNSILFPGSIIREGDEVNNTIIFGEHRIRI